METDSLVYDELVNSYTEFMDSMDIETNTSYISHECDVSDFLVHHGIKNQKWGVRRYQNPDGSLTALGRVHYGVGTARRGVGKAAGTAAKAVKKVGHAIRGKIAPTDQQLQEQYDKAKRKADRKAMKIEIQAIKGRPKNIRDMSDQEVIDAINRYRNEKTLKALKKDANKSAARLAIEDAARRGLSDAVTNTVRNALGTAGQNIIDAMDTGANKAKREREKLTNELAIKSLSGNKKEAKEARKALDATEKAVKGKYKNNDQNNKKNDKDQNTNDQNNRNDEREARRQRTEERNRQREQEREDFEQGMNERNNARNNETSDRDARRQRTEERNRQREQEQSDFESGMNDRRQQRESEPEVTYEVPNRSTSEFIRDTGRDMVTDAVRGIDYEFVSDHIELFGSRKTKSLPPARS